MDVTQKILFLIIDLFNINTVDVSDVDVDVLNYLDGLHSDHHYSNIHQNIVQKYHQSRINHRLLSSKNEPL